jgi:hypothetical protein
MRRHRRCSHQSVEDVKKNINFFLIEKSIQPSGFNQATQTLNVALEWKSGCQMK